MKPTAWVRSILWLSLAAPALPAGELIVDHATVAVPQLAPAEAALEKLGFHFEYGGPHANGVTEMALASFADGSYLELIAWRESATAAARSAHYWKNYIDGDAGPCAWAVRSADVTAEAARLRAAGVVVSQPMKSGRTRPDGVRLDWETASVGAAAQGALFPFLIRDFTPREKRAFPGGQPNNPNFRGVKQVSIAVKDLNEAINRWKQAYGLTPKAVTHMGASDVAYFLDAPITLNASHDNQSDVSRRIARFGEGVYAFGIEDGQGRTIWVK